MESLQLEVEDFIASRISENPTEQVQLMERILERDNMNRAIKRKARFVLWPLC